MMSNAPILCTFVKNGLGTWDAVEGETGWEVLWEKLVQPLYRHSIFKFNLFFSINGGEGNKKATYYIYV
jgi:hypothetical protein